MPGQRMTRLRSRLGRERGGVLVIVAIFMATAIGIATFVIDAGHWFEHKRHLQAQVDAGAFAGATTFNGCFGASAADRASSTSPANLAIAAQARKFAGDTLNVPTALNAQVNNRSNVTVLLNSRNFPGDGGANYDDPAGPPCQAGYVDVKATDANVASFLGSGLVPKIKAHARVLLESVGSLSGSLPLAVEDIKPTAIGALFVNIDAASFSTSAAAVLGRQGLTPGSTSTLNGLNLTPWTGGPVAVPISSPSPPSAQAHVGVVIAMCSNRGLCPNAASTSWFATGAVSTVCGQLYITCRTNDGTGIEMIHGYATGGTGTATAPIVRSVTLTKGGAGACTDDSAPYFLLNAACKVGAQADIDFGVTGNPATLISARVSVGSCNLSYSGSTGTTSSWSAANCQTIASGAGQAPLNLTWQTGSGRTTVNGTFSNVARPFANDGATDTQSYPIAYAQVTQGAACTAGVGNSVAFGTTNFCVGVGVLGSLQVAANTSDPTVLLKFINGSRNGPIACGGSTLRDDIINGCTTPVNRNPGEACPNTTTPADCVPLRTGGKVGQVRDGMNTRFAPGDVCSANNWSLYPNIPVGDPRVVPLIITLEDAFSGSGSGSIPVTDFGVFYITGWDGGPNSTSCNSNNEPAPPGAGNGTVWGHFIVYAGDLGTSTGSGTCSFALGSLSPCIPVLTE